MILFIIFVIIPLIEISLFITVGDAIGLFNTLFLCFLTAVIGSVFIRHQGLKTLFSARSALNHNEMPVQEMFDGICIAVAGALLLTPGFFTDAIGFSLLVPPFREFMRKEIAKRMDVYVAGQNYTETHHYRRPQSPDVIDAEYERLDEDEEQK